MNFYKYPRAKLHFSTLGVNSFIDLHKAIMYLARQKVELRQSLSYNYETKFVAFQAKEGLFKCL